MKVIPLRLNSEQSQPMVIVGSVAYDTIITPKATGERLLGGSASYAALAASYYTKCRLVGIVGKDFNPAFIEQFKNHNICLEGLQKDEESQTFFWKGKYSADGNQRDTLDLQLNIFETFEPHLPELYRQTPYALLGNIRPALQHKVCDQLEGTPFIIADTIDHWINTEREAFLALFARINCLVINDSEAELLTGENNIINAGNKLIELGLESLIIKKGAHGACLFHPQGLFMLPAYPVTELVDLTGAGDSFAGALLGYLAAKHKTDFVTLKQAMLYATATASLTVEALSCDRLESAGAAAIQKRVEELKAIISL